MQIIKVRYYSETTGEMSNRSYTYYSEDILKVGDIVIVPVKDTVGKAKVDAIDVPESEIEAFKDKVKVIPAGSVILADTKTAEQLTGVKPDYPPEFIPPSPHLSQPDTDIFPPATISKAIDNSEAEVAVIKIKPQDDPRVRALADEATKLRDYAVARTIKTDADCKPATEDLSVIARVKKALTEAKADYVKPIRGHLDDVNAAFTLILAPLDEADKVTRNKILAYREEQAKRAAEAEEINRQKAELARREAQFNGTGEITIDTTPVQAQEPVKRVSTDIGTASVQKVTTWELVDFAAVPDQYKILDAGKITKLVKGGGTIPGIKVIVKEGLRVTTR